MASVNKAILVGHLGKDPDVRATQSGTDVVSFSLATSTSWKDKVTGQRKDNTEWHTVVIFNERLADVAKRFLKKGSKVYIEGKIKTRKWTDQQGQERRTTEVVLEQYGGELTLLDSQSNRPAAATSQEDYGTTRTSDDPRTQAGAAAEKPDFDDEIPF